MTTKTTKYLSLLVVLAVAIGAGTFALTTNTVDADDTNKGIGTTEIWEPGPTDGFTPTEKPDRMYAVAETNSYKSIKDSGNLDIRNEIEYQLTDEQFDIAIEKIQDGELPVVYSAVDYNGGYLVIYSPNSNLGDKIESIIGTEIPYVLLFEEAPARWSTGDPGEEDGIQLEPKVELQSSWLPTAFAAGTV